ncbi:MAG: hypothetical protein WA989_03145 [Henriciella sp.]|uniref:hypothetical protein n=1 Tax=Henriciella sp. TaxID=1968823 RepID=UPI003C752E2E
MRVTLVFSLCLLVGAPMSFGQGAAAAEGYCTPSNTKEISLRDVLKSPFEFESACVTVEGYATARALFYRKSDLKVRYPAQNNRIAKRRLGIYGPEELMERVSSLHGSKLRLTGKIFDCSDLYVEGVVMVMGYCHYTDGPFIDLDQVETID